MDQVVADLKSAEIKALDTYGNIPADKGRITKLTASTILADVYLWRADVDHPEYYTDCIAQCDKVINSGKFGLVPGDAQWFNTLYVAQNSIEGIFELQFDAQSLNPYFNLFSQTVKSHFLAYVNLIDNYSFDVDNVDNIDIRSYDVAVHQADLSIYKYIATSPTSTRSSNTSYAHWYFYRYADILLMKAEACINSTPMRGQDALDLINQIRTRANALPGTEQSPAVDDVAGLTDYLVAERGREFAFEGKRWYDLLRNAKRNHFARIDILSDAALISVPPLNLQSALNKLKDPNALYFPIPQTDITNDPNLIQNPFYK